MQKASVIVPCVAIRLTHGHVALVDEQDAQWLSQWRWFARVRGPGDIIAERNEMIRGRRFVITMHQLIIGDVPAGEFIHHVNGWRLDNRRCNLVLGPASFRRILRPPSSRPDKTSRFKGVHRAKPTQAGAPRWRATIMVAGKNKYLGIYDNEVEAAQAYDRAAIKYFGPHAFLNFPEKRQEYIQWVQPANRPWATADTDEDDEYGSVFLLPPRIEPPIGGTGPRGRI